MSAFVVAVVLARVPRKQPLVAMIMFLIVGTSFWLGAQAFQNMYQRPWVKDQISHLVRTFHT